MLEKCKALSINSAELFFFFFLPFPLEWQHFFFTVLWFQKGILLITSRIPGTNNLNLTTLTIKI